MAKITEIQVPNIGDFDAVEVIEVLVQPGAVVAIEDALITLESDKASMDIPAPVAGTITAVLVAAGDRVAEGSVIATIEVDESVATPEAAAPERPAQKPLEAKTSAQPAASPGQKPADTPEHATPEIGPGDLQCDLVVIGAGPGGYSAAFRAADLGKNVIIVEKHSALGGVCLNVGCIPSKALLHAAKVIDEAEEMRSHGISFGSPAVDIDKLRGWKESVVKKLTGGLAGLAKRRRVQVVQGIAEFSAHNQLKVVTSEGEQTIGFANAIIAVGSRPTEIPVFPNDDDRLMDSTDALRLKDIPGRLLIVGGGIIGLEMATVYNSLGSKITVVELMDGLIPAADRDLVKSFQRYISKRYENIYLSTKVEAIESSQAGLVVSFNGRGAPEQDTFDRVLISVGRRPNGLEIAAEKAGVAVDQHGFISVDNQLRTNIPHIFAIGDVVGQPMLAHKAVHEGKVAAEVIAGEKAYFDARCIPSVAYTDPEIGWVGTTEQEAKEKGVAFEKGSFPWAASGRSLSIGRSEGMTKLLFDPETKRVIGGGIVGTNAGELIAEIALAIEMGAVADDIGLTIHPHPTLSETVAFSAEAFAGTLTDL